MDNFYLSNLIKKHKHNFSSIEKKISDYFLNQGNELVNKTIKNISDETDISQTSIFNFVKTLGFDGFNDFKISLATNLKPINNDNTEYFTAFSDIESTDSPNEMFDKIINFNIESIKNMKSTFPIERLENVINIMKQSKTLHFFGQGGSSIVAYDAYHKFLRTKYLCNYIGDHHMQLSYSTKLDDSDCVLLFSHSGQSTETYNIAEVLKETSAKVIVLTGDPGSPLIPMSDEHLVILSAESKFRTESLTSRILYLTIIDVLYTAIMYQDEQGNQSSMQRIRQAISHSKTTDDFIL